MGIHKPTYRRFQGKTSGWKGRVFTIFKNEFMRRLHNKWVLALLLISWALGILPILLGAPFIAYFIFSFIWLLLFTSVVGGPIFAEDFQYNSITLYLSRPLQRFDYFLGKYLTLFGLIALIAIIPNIIISAFIIGVSYGTSTSDFDYYQFSYSLIGIGFVMTFVFTNIGLVFSAITKNYKYASGGIFTFIFFSNILSLALSNLSEDITYLSIWANLMIIFSDWNGLQDNSVNNFDANISLAILMIISLICLAIIWFRIQRTDISE